VLMASCQFLLDHKCADSKLEKACVRCRGKMHLRTVTSQRGPRYLNFSGVNLPRPDLSRQMPTPESCQGRN